MVGGVGRNHYRIYSYLLFEIYPKFRIGLRIIIYLLHYCVCLF